METNKIYNMDCIEGMKQIPDNSIDSIVTDPPYGLGFMNKEWDSPTKHRELVEREQQRSEQRFKEGKSPTTAGFTRCVQPGLAIKGGKENRWFQEWCELWAIECFRILKPGGYLLSFSATRTYHRMASAIEDAGFEIRDMIEWVYGSGFPKSLNIGKAVDKLQGNEREDLGFNPNSRPNQEGKQPITMSGKFIYTNLTKGTSEWEGWGTALKPAHEPIVVARKPLSEKTVAENVLKYGTGGINIDESRVGTTEEDCKKTNRLNVKEKLYNTGIFNSGKGSDISTGRFPANFIHDGSEEVLQEFEKAGVSISSGGRIGNKGSMLNMCGNIYEKGNPGKGDTGTPARFFKSCEFELEDAPSFIYQAKASKSERNEGCEELEEKSNELIGQLNNSIRTNGTIRTTPAPKKNSHPTVKPLKLMEYLVKLVTPKGGVCLDPFMGSGTTAVACKKNGFKYLGFEKEAEYIKIINARLSAVKQQIL